MLDESSSCYFKLQISHLNEYVSVEAIHLANLLCQHGYFFPVGDNRTFSVKDDSSLYRFQVTLLLINNKDSGIKLVR